MNKRHIVLVVILVLVGGLYFYLNKAPSQVDVPGPAGPIVDVSASLPLDEDTKEKIRHYIDGVRIEPHENNLDHAISLDHSVGRPQLSAGNLREAYETYRKVLAISYYQGSLMGIGIGLGILVKVAQSVGDKGEALDTAFLGYKVFQALNNHEELGIMELGIGRLLRAENRSQAMMWILRAKENLENTRYREDYVRLLADLAGDLRFMGEDDQASATYEEAWQKALSLGSSPSQKWAKWEAGQAYAADLRRSKRYKKALDVLTETESFFSSSEKQAHNYTANLLGFSRVYSAQNNRAEAERYYLSAYTTYELMRAKALGENGRAVLDKQYKGLIDEFVDYHLDRRDYSEALALLESNKARTLNDILDDQSYRETSSQWKEIQGRHATELLALLQGVEKTEQQEQRLVLEEAFSLLKRQRDERRKLQTRLQLKEMTVTQGLSKQQIEEIQSQLTSDVAVLSYFVSGNEVSAFLMTRGRIQHIPLRLTAAEMYRTAQQLRLALTNANTDYYLEPARALFRQILAPVIKRIPASNIVIYSPDGILSRIPLSVLMDGNSFIGERYAFHRVPSLRYVNSVAATKAAPAQSGVSCVDPNINNARLPYQRETSATLDELYGARLTAMAGDECSETELISARNRQKRPTFLHIGAHGNFYPDTAMESAILLSAGNGVPQVWNARAMATVDMTNIDLITLSSCETGLTDPKIERDVFGIARALFFAGADTIVAPLWMVHDQATSQFMQAFYRSYSGGTPTTLSLQVAQKALLEGEYSHPYYWSAFVLMGALQ